MEDILAAGLRYGPIGPSAVHLCVDMQRIFSGDSPWAMVWFQRVLPNIELITAQHPSESIFTRFIPADRPGEGPGLWSKYYTHWADMTLSRLDEHSVELVEELARFIPPARVFDKRVYSPWHKNSLYNELYERRKDTLVITGGETDVCVLATVLGAIDFGFRVIVVTDAICSSSDEAHDAMLTHYHQRYSQQVETATTDIVLDSWAI
jgi:nicotinamidase-related amidase